MASRCAIGEAYRAQVVIGRLIPNSDGAANNWSVNTKPPAPIDGSRRLAPSWTHYGSIHETYGTTLSWNFAADWTLTLAHRQSQNGREYSQPYIFSDSAGNYSLQAYNFTTRFQNSQSQAMINGVFTTGPVLHELAVGASYFETTARLGVRDWSIWPRGIFAPIPNVGNLSNPVEVNNPLGPFTPYKDAKNGEFFTNYRRELFLSDTLSIGEDWDIILGLRHGNWDSKLTDYDKSAITPPLPPSSVHWRACPCMAVISKPWNKGRQRQEPRPTPVKSSRRV